MLRIGRRQVGWREFRWDAGQVLHLRGNALLTLG